MRFCFTLQLQHDGAGGIDDFDVVLGGDSVGFGRFAVGSQQYFHVVQLFELLVVYGDEPFGFEPFHLVAVVYDVAEAVESSGAVEFFFGFADSRDYTEAEPECSSISMRAITCLLSTFAGGLSKFFDGFFVPGHEPCVLLGDCHVGIVELYGIVGFAQRAFFTGLVDVVAFVDVGDHFVEIDIDTFRPQFVDASLCPSLCRGRDEYFQFGMREYSRALYRARP